MRPAGGEARSGLLALQGSGWMPEPCLYPRRLDLHLLQRVSAGESEAAEEEARLYPEAYHQLGAVVEALVAGALPALAQLGLPHGAHRPGERLRYTLMLAGALERRRGVQVVPYAETPGWAF